MVSKHTVVQYVTEPLIVNTFNIAMITSITMPKLIMQS